MVLVTNKSCSVERDGFLAADGREITLWRWPQSDGRPMLHWAHATGFHGRLYKPLLDELSVECNIIAWDMRGHGASSDAAVASTFRGWETYYQDLTALLAKLDEPVWLGGHSIGATSSIMAAARQPDKVLGLILLEPVIMDSWQSRMLWLSKLLRRSHRLSLAAGAARRRNVFDSYVSALENYRGRGGFKTWPESWLEAYVQHAFIQDGDRLRLACSPLWESSTFAQTEHNPWPGIRQLKCPVVAIAAERASTFSSLAQRRLGKILPSAEVRVLAGTTHFLPMEQTELVRDAMLKSMLPECRRN